MISMRHITLEETINTNDAGDESQWESGFPQMLVIMTDFSPSNIFAVRLHLKNKTVSK